MGLRVEEKPLVMGGGIRRVPKVRGPLLGVPIKRIRMYWGLYRGPLLLGNCHMARYND